MSSIPDPKEKGNTSGNESDTGLSTAREDEDTISPVPQPQDDSDDALAVIRSNARVEIIDNKPVFKPTREFLLAYSAICILALAIAFDATSLSVALPIISTALGGTALEAFWSGTSFLLASTVLQPTVASLSNIFGRKYMIYVTAALFAAGSLIAALGNNFTVLLVGRAIQGVGGGGLLALAEVVVTDLVPLAFRGNWLSLLSAMWSIGTVTGPLIGAGFAQNITWRWIFYINLPVIGIGMVFVVLFLNQAKIPGHILEKLGRFDWLGCFLFTASSTGFLFGLTTGGVMYDWGSWRVLLPLIIGPIGLAVFGYWEVKFAREPIIHRGIFNNRDLIVTYFMTVLHGMVLWSLLYFLPLYYQGVKFYSPVTSAVALLPQTLTVAPAGAVVGIIAGMTGHYRGSVWVGWFFTTFGAGLLLLLQPETSTPAWIFLNIPVGVGTGMLFPAMGLTVQAACDPMLNGQAAAFFSFLRTFGQSIGVAVSGVIFQNVFKQKLQAIPAYAPLAFEYSRDATIVVDMINHMPNNQDRYDLIVAFNEALHNIWISMIAFSAVALVLSVAIKGYSLNQVHMTQQALIQAEKPERESDPEKQTA
ncbi:major facilitator superfamily transporter multidrug resistance [Apodospora peruviana]|uniref:Major facilitator superfamily transporter multidrug resistance n=1 Tax=Apodospora peruviana TaxID=516989 RepID=A0AAE0M4Z6_9PEZI|nr:major facilitator superfamily transporter multidrug resistance [Apodospora peruviana]